MIIADGLRGNNQVLVPLHGAHVKNAHIAADIHNADGLVVLSHFKGHELYRLRWGTQEYWDGMRFSRRQTRPAFQYFTQGKQEKMHRMRGMPVLVPR